MRWGARLVPVALASGLLAPSAAATPNDIDLRDTYLSKMVGAGEVGGGGDFDGDGNSDVITAYAAADPLGREDAGIAYVALGPLRDRFAGLRRDDFHGFRILGAAENDNLSPSCVVGDLNADGRDDVVIGAQQADTPNGAYSGAAYVVFGSTDDEDVDLAGFHDGSQGSRGYRIDGAGGFDLAGIRVACLGDVNLDGLGDMAVAAPFNGATYVVFGKADTSAVDLRLFDLDAQGTAGFRIDTPIPKYNDQYYVGEVGDVNDDGRPDVAMGVFIDAHKHPGTVYVVFGKDDPLPVDAREEGGWGYRIRGAHEGDETGSGLATAGDFNGDGVDDFVVGVPALFSSARARAYVIFGSEDASDIELGDLGSRGVLLRGGSGDNSGYAAAPAGDVDGDGLGDVLIGAMYAPPDATGVAYLVRGSRSSRSVSLLDLGRRGYAIHGARRGDQIGSTAASYVDLATDKIRFLVGGYNGLKTYVVKPR